MIQLKTIILLLTLTSTLAFSILSFSSTSSDDESSASNNSVGASTFDVVASNLVKAGKTAAGVGVLTVFALSASPTGLSAEYPLKFRIMAQLRTPLMVFIVVPLSFARWFFNRAKLFLAPIFFRSAKIGSEELRKAHQKRVQTIVDQVHEWRREGKTRKMRTARPNWAAMSTKLDSNKGKSFRVKIGHLNHILELDLQGDGIKGSPYETPTITVEPGVTHGMITDLLLPMGYALEVQVEMENITIGGNAMGLGMETNSHLYGLFQETVTRYEIVAASGKVHDVTEESDPELFHTLPWSHGSIGFLTAVTVRGCVCYYIDRSPTHSNPQILLSFLSLRTQELRLRTSSNSNTGTFDQDQTVRSRSIRSDKQQRGVGTFDEALRRIEER